MLDGLTLEVFANLGSGGVVLAVVWMIFTGRLVTRREVEGILQDRNYWRTAYFQSQKLSENLAQTSEVTRDVLRSLPIPNQGEADDA